MILLILLLSALLWLVVFRYQRRHMYNMAAKFGPVSKEMPLVGILLKLTGNTEDIMEQLKRFSYVTIKNNGISRGWLGHILYFVMTDPRDLEYVLKTCMEKDDLHRFLRKIIGYGGIFAPVPIWRRRRKVMVPAFSPKIVESFVDVFSEQSEKLAKHLQRAANGDNFAIWPYLTSYTLDAVSETVMGIKVNAQDDPNVPFLTSLNTILNLVCERIFHLWLQPEWLYKFFPQYKEHQKVLKIAHDFTDKVIRKKRIDLKLEEEEKTEADTQYDTLQIYKRKPFLDYLIAFSGGVTGYSNEELREEVLTMTIAGTDTSAVAMGYTLILLGKYPHVQERVFQELYDIFGDSDRPLVKEDLFNMKFLERVVKESLRLFPPVPFIIRKVEEDIVLPSGRMLPAGSGVAVSIWGVHRDPAYWGPQAEHFDPDRFLPERLNLPHACNFMPFSQGPRNCVGYQYALMSIKASIANVIRHYKVIGEPEKGPIPHIPVKLDIMMKAVDGCTLALQRRNKNYLFDKQ